MTNYKEVKEIEYIVEVYYKDGTTENIHQKSWLSPSQLELSLRETYDNAEDTLITKLIITWEDSQND